MPTNHGQGERLTPECVYLPRSKMIGMDFPPIIDRARDRMERQGCNEQIAIGIEVGISLTQALAQLPDYNSVDGIVFLN